METTSEFDGEMIWLIVGILFCLPAGIYYFISNKAEKQVCPECGETTEVTANNCPSCNASLSE